MRISDWSSDVCSSDLSSLIDGAPLGALMLGGALLFSFYQLRKTAPEHVSSWERQGLPVLAVLGLSFLYLLAPLFFFTHGTAIAWALAGLATLFAGLRLQSRSFLFTAFAVQLRRWEEQTVEPKSQKRHQ